MVAALSGVSMRGAENSESPAKPAKETISEKIVHEVEEKLPKYNPPPKPTTEAAPAAEEASGSPDVLRLPTVTVTAETPLPPDWAMVTPKERLARAMKARPGLKIGNLFGLNTGYALAMQYEEREVQKKAELAEIVKNTRTDNSEESKRVDQLLKAAMARNSPGWTKIGCENLVDDIG